MATEIVEIVTGDVGKDMARTILGAVIRQIKDVVDLEENLQVLHKDFAHMVCFLEHIQNRFQDQHRMLPKPAEMCLRKMGDALTEAKQLIHRVNQQRTRCFGCCILCNPNLSRECREWKTTFDHLFEQLQRDLQILADTEQIVSTAAPEAKPLLLQPVPDAGFVGSDIKDAEMQLQRWLAEPPHRVVGVWGMGGIGKTSLLKIIHNHFQKVSRIFEIVIWVTVSQNFKVEGFYNSIAKALDMKLDEKIDSNRARTEVCTFLENKKFLLILDDLWEPIDLDEVGFSFGNVDKGSKVLISTRSAEVIAAMGAKDSCWEMKLLSEEEAWEVFKSKAFKNGSAALDTNIEAIAREIAKECKGLPLAVNVVGAAMTVKKTKDDWGRALTLMRNTDPNFPKVHKGIDAQLYQNLMYSYNDLPDHNLKCCFLYCAAFPEDEEINAERLVEIWIAEGLLTGKDTTYLMDVGHDYLDLLANRCLIQYVVPGEYKYVPVYEYVSGYYRDRYDDDEYDSGRYEYVKTIKIHDVLRDMAIHIGESEEHWLFATDQRLTNFPGEKEISNCNRISLDHNDIQELAVLKCPNLVSLLLPSNNSLRHVPQPFLSSVISLRVLDLSRTGITELPISVGELRLLEFLDLSYCQKLIELPESIGNLSALQFFNLDSCGMLKGLPSTIRGLKKLKHLNLVGCNDMEVNSDDIGQLISLNRLVISLNRLDHNAVRAGDLINLTKLQVLNASVWADGGDVTIDTWTEMKRLTLWFRSNGVKIEKIERVEMLQLTDYGGVTLPHCEFQNLKVVLLRECEKLRELPLRSFPMLTVLKLHDLEKLESLSGPSNVWNEGSMSKLQELIIRYCPLLKKLPLGMRLPNLKVLEIGYCDSIKELDIGNGDFPMLEELELAQLKELESITGSSGVWNEEATSKLERVEISGCQLLKKLPKLERVEISGCPLLKKLPLGMRLPNLKVLDIRSCDSIKALDIGNGDFPMLEELELAELKELESITGCGVWNEEATSKLESVEITGCPLLRRLPRAMEKLFSLNKLHWEDRDESVVLSELFGE